MTVTVDLSQPGMPSSPPRFTDVLPQTEHVLESVAASAGTHLIACYLAHVKHVLKQYAMPERDGALCAFEREVPLPSLGTVSSFSAERAHGECYFSFTSFLYPGARHISAHAASGAPPATGTPRPLFFSPR